MKILSEKTGKEYASVDECIAAEKEYDEAVAAKKAAEEKALAERKAVQEKQIAERKEAAKVVEEKRQALLAAHKDYQEELKKFCDKYGAYHITLKNGDKSLFELFDDFFNFNHFWL